MIINIKGYDVQIDEEDWDKVKGYNWNIDKQYSRKGLAYVTTTITINGKKETIKLHRLLLGCVKGDGIIVDHINHNTLDNRKINLRKCTIAENNMNQSIAKNNTTGYKGVWYRQDNGCYRALLRCGGKRYNCGQYTTAIEAAEAYDKMAIYIFGKFAKLNFPDNIYSDVSIKEMQTLHETRAKPPPTSKYRGVHFNKNTNKWASCVHWNNTRTYLGLYSTEIEAAMAYDKKAKELLGDKAKLNFPENKGATR